MSSSKGKRHPKYYFEDGNVVFLTTDKTLFRLHKCILNLHSSFFRDMFEHNHPPAADDKGKKTPAEGSSDDNPIELGGHALATLRDTELESICKVLYEMPATPLTELKVEEAIELLHVSTKFQFEAIHEKAICILDSAILPPWRRYSLGVDCLVDPWILRSYVETCSTVDYAPSELSVEFSRRNEMDKLTALLSVREQYRTTLLIYSYEDKWAPYARTAQHMHTADSLVCLACLKVMKALLQRILSSGGPSDLDGADGAKLPLLEDRVFKGIQPRSQNTLKLCDGCRTKGAVHQILGVTDLENEVRRVMRLSS